MRSHLYGLAADAYPGHAVGGAVVAARPRGGVVVSALATVLSAGSGLGLGAVLGWPTWLSGAVAGGAASIVYALLTEAVVLVLLPGRVCRHRTNRINWFRTALGPYDGDVPSDEIERVRRGLLNDVWRIEGSTSRLSRSDSARLADELARR